MYYFKKSLAKISVSIMGTLALLMFSVAARASAPTGAIFTTISDGTEVNFNQYLDKNDVYLDGGPGPGAPVTAAGLDNGTYVFQVTDPSGKTLLSTDIAACREFVVTGGIITSVVPTGCQHLTGVDLSNSAVTVQLMPFLDTPNKGGVYKVWVTKVADFLTGCADLGVADGLSVVNCGKASGNFHGFVPSDSKTDNFKIHVKRIREIDTRFFSDQDNNGIKSPGENWIDGLTITWIDPLLASNVKYSYENLSIDVHHEAHVEAVEDGVHNIQISDQPGCNVGAVYVDGVRTLVDGPQLVQVPIRESFKEGTVFIDVACQP
ncbi:hypothetical protein [Geomesophilobacter sediminis]|uniref:Uncharacterized protein n=1 Tax=Geomesophilobacter sediminis TaxID=2798584 RepID=A0A8J7J802_9BACT|nr:hypothetical protein [Geomesophilobacter sediminis]MBJ6725591.1 hypothetical protein [Geomesophilobacter sediminis]